MKPISEAELEAIDDLVGVPPARDNGQNVSAPELANWIGLTPNRCHALARDGIVPRNPDSTFPLKRAVRAYADHARAGALGRRAEGQLAEEKIRLAREGADKVALQNAKARGEMIPTAEVARAWSEVVTDLRAAVLAIPSRVAGRCGLDRRAAAALDEEIRVALGAVADEA